MRYILKNELSINQAKSKLEYHIKKGSTIEIIEKRKKKSVSHNAYAHLLFGWFALSYGETTEYVKQEIFKKVVNPDLFKTERINKVTGEVRQAWKSFADLDNKQTSIAIDRFRNWSSKNAGIYLPEPSDLVAINEIENQINQNKQYL